MSVFYLVIVLSVVSCYLLCFILVVELFWLITWWCWFWSVSLYLSPCVWAAPFPQVVFCEVVRSVLCLTLVNDPAWYFWFLWFYALLSAPGLLCLPGSAYCCHLNERACFLDFWYLCWSSFALGSILLCPYAARRMYSIQLYTPTRNTPPTQTDLYRATCGLLGLPPAREYRTSHNGTQRWAEVNSLKDRSLLNKTDIRNQPALNNKHRSYVYRAHLIFCYNYVIYRF